MIRFVDSFDHYNTSQIDRKWSAIIQSMTIGSSNGRGTSSNALRYTGGSNAAGSTSYVMKTLDSRASWIIGFAFKYNIPPSNTSFHLFQAFDDATMQLGLRLNQSGTISILRGDGTVLATSTFALSINRWYYIEFKFTIANSISSNTCIVHVNSEEIINLSSTTDTQNSSNATANSLVLGTRSNLGNQVTSTSFLADYDDLYICDTSGSVNNSFLSDVKVVPIYPNANGAFSQFVGSDADSTNNYQLTDENPADDDTTYVETSTAGNKDTYGYGDVSTTITIKGIQICTQCKKTDGGTRTILPIIRLSGIDYDQSTVNISDNYAIYHEIIESNPNTVTTWTGSDINNAQFGFKLVA